MGNCIVCQCEIDKEKWEELVEAEVFEFVDSQGVECLREIEQVAYEGRLCLECLQNHEGDC